MTHDLYYWGENRNSQNPLHDSTYPQMETPQATNICKKLSIKQLSSGHYGTFINTFSGEVYTLLLNDDPKENKMKKLDQIQNCIKIQTGYYFFAALTKSGIYIIGDIETEHENLSNLKKEYIDIIPPKINNDPIVDLICGSRQLFLLTLESKIYGVGGTFSEFYELENRFSLELYLIMQDIKKVFTGNYSHSLFLVTNSNDLYCSGYNFSGELEGEIVKIVCAHEHSLMLTKQNGKTHLYSTGQAKWNGLGKDEMSPVFTKIDFFDGYDILEIECGCYHSIVYVSGYRLFGFGMNTNHELGIPNSYIQKTPVEINIPNRIPDLLNCHICCGSFNSFLYFSNRFLLGEDLIHFFKKQENCDLHLRIGDGSYLDCHKLIIKHRIKQDNLSKFQNFIFSKTKDEAKEIIEFIYGGILPDDDELFNELRKIRNFDPKNVEFELIKDLKTLRNEEESKDFTIKSNQEEIHIHKIILWARSDLFRGMFLNVIDDSNQVTDYSGISSNSFKIFINFLYSGQIETNEEITNEIIDDLEKAMDFFQLNELEPNLYTLAKEYKEKEEEKKN
ncbi:btk-binding protein-related [Anaeramoeba ignava]|uniref:Btk-binding protein-related n=1 Tax=Anaeramoeba ignava TaxID=1746090 RepID=A0A9Q0LDC2_ANAIG|nr:btk-binding protein-related [Anaeramoeba ignava]